MTRDEQYRTRVRAAALISRSEAQFSHESAAAMWRLPSIGPWPDIVHELTDTQPGGTSRVGIRRHGLGLDDHATIVDDVVVTSLERTVVDMACTTSFVRAVAMADAALHVPDETEWRRKATTALDLTTTLDSLRPYRGLAKAQRVLDFADGRSESPGESFSRVQFHALGYPPPLLQIDFFDEIGFIGCVDFYWPQLGLIGEFDGLSKYGRKRRYQSGLTLDQILMIEKKREDRLRRVSSGFVRLDWQKVSNRRALAGFLRPHGLVEGRGSRRAPTSEPFSVH